jgi:16S rRNA (uracil1498-N3)-methyltransferase
MRTPRFYTNQHLAPTQAVTLDDEASHHILRVLRLRRDDALVLFNGDGNEYSAVVADSAGKLATVLVSAAHEAIAEPSLRIDLGQGISRGERMDFVLQKSVELGVNSVTPLSTIRTQVQLNGRRLEKRLAHWRAIMRSACEQCGRAVIPPLHNATTLPRWCESSGGEQLRLVLDPAAPMHLRDLAPVTRVSILIGPEGGLNIDELRVAEDNGFQRVRLGPRTLRTETAALAALAAIQTLWGDLAV